MKLVKMSLAAAMLMGVSAFAVENTKVAGDAKLYYQTSDEGDSELFDQAGDAEGKGGAAGQAAIGLGVTADLLENVSASVHLTALSTLGLQNQLVSGVWEGTNGVSDYYWYDEAWIAATVGKTTAKAGRMALDTPLVFSETWSIASNTFEGAVLLNQDLPDTTLVGAYVGGGNGSRDNSIEAGSGAGAVIGAVNANGTTNFGQFWGAGAYAAGIVNNSFKPLTLQGWYYDATRVINAYWLQADLNMEGIIAGAQYTGQTYQAIPDSDAQDAYAVKLGFESDAFTISGAFSQTGSKSPDMDGRGAPLNVGANLAGSGQSKLYTEAWWNYGKVTQPDTSTFNITATAQAGEYALSAFYTNADCDFYTNADNGDLQEFTAEVDRSFGPLDTSLVYINTTFNNGSSFNILQVYLTLNY